MNERLVEDWLNKANERSYQTPFAQSLLSEGMHVLRVGHGPHEHGKDVIAVDSRGRVHAYQLKDGNLDLKSFENSFAQVCALVEAQVEHPALGGRVRHQPWLVFSGESSMPVEDRIRVHNLSWAKRGYKPLRTICGAQLRARFCAMASNFWPQAPEDSRDLLSLYLADGNGNLDRAAFAKLILGIVNEPGEQKKTMVLRRLAAANLFASYGLSPFFVSNNHWELVQGWVITAAQIAYAADAGGIAAKAWKPTFRLAMEAALAALELLAEETLEPDALRPRAFAELDELTRSRCTICAGIVAARVLIGRCVGTPWKREGEAKAKLEKLCRDGRLYVWGESAVAFFLTIVWALDKVRPDPRADRLLLDLLLAIVAQNSRLSNPKLPFPHFSADEANAKAFGRIFQKETALELQAMVSYTIEPLVALMARRLWRGELTPMWEQLSRIGCVRLIPDVPRDLLLWDWSHERGANQTRLFGAPQSWKALLEQSRSNESDALPRILREQPDFCILFLLTFPHRMTVPLVKHLDST